LNHKKQQISAQKTKEQACSFIFYWYKRLGSFSKVEFRQIRSIYSSCMYFTSF